MKILRHSFFVSILLFSQFISAASVQVALGPVVKKQQAQSGSYWVQLAAVKQMDGVERIRKSNPGLKIAFHTDNKGLKRVLAGPYESFRQADTARVRMGKGNAFIRFIKKQVAALKPVSKQPDLKKPEPQKPEPQKAEVQQAARSVPSSPVKSFIEKEKQECAEAGKTVKQSASDADCVCCIHIRNNTLIRH